MPKAYWMFHATITDLDTYKKYVERDGEAFARYGARFLARGGEALVVEGSSRTRHVIIEFESLAVARACYESPEYQAVSEFRRAGAMTDLVIVEGVG